MDALDAAGRGECSVMLIGGEPGVGKTRLLVEAASVAYERGWHVLLGRTFESDSMPPYLPFVEASGSTCGLARWRN
jgi:predicted ATP-dependent serine protease